MKPVVSIIMPTYNHERFIKDAVNSILNQICSYSYEIVIGDDCSTDSTREICRELKVKYPDRIVLIENDKNLGLLANYKSIISHARGKYLAILESDDLWNDNRKLQTQIDFLEHNPEYGLTYSNANFYYEEAGKEQKCVQHLHQHTGALFNRLIRGNFIIACTVCFRKELFDKHICIDEYIQHGFTTLDYPMWLELSAVTKFKYFNKPFSTYRITGSSISNNHDFSKSDKFMNQSINIVKYIINKYNYDPSLLRYVVNYCLIQNAKNHARNGDFIESRNIARKIKPTDLKTLIKRLLLINPLSLRFLSNRYLK